MMFDSPPAECINLSGDSLKGMICIDFVTI